MMGNSKAVCLLVVGLVVVSAALIAVISAWAARSTGESWAEVFQRGGVAFGGTVGVYAALVAVYRTIGGRSGE